VSIAIVWGISSHETWWVRVLAVGIAGFIGVVGLTEALRFITNAEKISFCYIDALSPAFGGKAQLWIVNPGKEPVFDVQILSFRMKDVDGKEALQTGINVQYGTALPGNTPLNEYIEHGEYEFRINTRSGLFQEELRLNFENGKTVERIKVKTQDGREIFNSLTK
jgi:hypothetical protein